MSINPDFFLDWNRRNTPRLTRGAIMSRNSSTVMNICAETSDVST